jgi:CRP-like cAMP-binding protein
MLREGRRQIAGFYFAGDAFGLESAEKHNVAAQAITNAEVRVIKKQALIALAASNREVANQLLTLTTRELARKQDLVLLLSRIPVTGISLAHAPDATLKDFSHDVLRGIATSPPTRPPPV